MVQLRAFIGVAYAPGLIIAAILGVMTAAGDMTSAILLGTGIASLVNPVTWLFAILGLFARSSWQAVAACLAVAVVSRIGLSRIDPFNWAHELTSGLGAFCVMAMLIALVSLARVGLSSWFQRADNHQRGE
jgi:hypothetical protein